MNKTPRLITGHVIYVGPHLGFMGLSYNKTFINGIYPQYYDWIAKCPAIGELFIPIADLAGVMRELAFDYAHNMRGTTGSYVTFYREVQKWLASNQPQTNPSPSGIQLETTHA
jgi:hypothetical protein